MQIFDKTSTGEIFDVSLLTVEDGIHKLFNSKEIYKSIDLDETMACDAAVQADFFIGEAASQ
eukprot:3292725-Karenia_brevis.AAC.1